MYKSIYKLYNSLRLSLFIFSIFIFLSTVLFSCGGNISGNLLAVSNSNGQTIPFFLSSHNGSGSNYISSTPLVGLSTQNSFNIAVDVAYMYSLENRSNCDYFLTFSSNNVAYIDGPSAGTALALNAYSLLNNFSLSDDFIITGSMDVNGDVLPVGGIYEKVKSAISGGFKSVFVPTLSIPEKVLLFNLKNKYQDNSSFSIVEVNSFDEILNYEFYGDYYPIKDTLDNIKSPKREENISTYPFYNSYGILDIDKDMDDFALINNKVILSEENKLKELSSLISFDNANVNITKETKEKTVEKENLVLIENTSNSIIDYYKASIDNDKILMSKGYLFSSANDAFLNYIDIATLTTMYKSGVDSVSISSEKNKVENCLSNLPKVNMTTENFQWIISSDLREYWARNKLNSLDYVDGEDLLADDKYYLLKEIMTANAWCDISYSLRETAIKNSGGSRINESIWSNYSSNLLKEVEHSISEDSTNSYDKTHFKTAQMLFNDGKYGASVYDLFYFMEFSYNGYLTDSNYSNEKLFDELAVYKYKYPSSIWGKIYYSQAYHLSSKKENDSSISTKISALKLYKYSNDLDLITNDMSNLMQAESENQINKNSDLNVKFINSKNKIYDFLYNIYISILSIFN